MTDPGELYEDILEEISTVLIGNEPIVERLTISLLTEGHILLEGVPGVAKTTAANLFARATGLDYNRIQMTPDILPADVTGTHIYRESTGEFELERGPVFANIVVADEINRATAKTQSALLEAMQERTVTIGGETLDLPTPFMVIATQNPIEMEGTYSLPEAQRDRFQFRLTVELPDRDVEAELLDRVDADHGYGPEAVEQVVTPEDLLAAREAVEEVYIDESVKGYALDLVGATRDNPNLAHGASPRASIAFLKASKAYAAIQGREYVIPDDIKALAPEILSHRLVLSTEAELSDVTTEDVVGEVLETIAAPSSEQISGDDGADLALGDGGSADDTEG